MPTARAFEVWGSPIDHSLSPTLHRAAYQALGLEWTYEKRDVPAESLRKQWESSRKLLSGLSLTMPLKEAICDLVVDRDAAVNLTHAANTVYQKDGEFALSNTDPFGVQEALTRHHVSATTAWILGAGATARAVGLALSRMGVETVSLLVRNPSRATQTLEILAEWGLAVTVHPLESLAHLRPPDLVASTIPGPAQADLQFPVAVRENSHLFDVAYAPWPSLLAAQWEESGKEVISGLWMLAYQALAQIRLFHHHDHARSLPNEHRVFEAMTSAVGLTST